MFVEGWVKEIMYHQINSNCNACYMWATVCPSYKIRSKMYQSWVLASKKQPNQPGGVILSAYCTCTAG